MFAKQKISCIKYWNLIKLHDAMSVLGVGLDSGLGLENLTATEMNYHL